MKTFKIITLIFLLIPCLFFSGKAQDKSITPLQIGDTIPDFLFKNIKNASYDDIQASKLYKKGLLIINFWATWCVPCVREMPTLDSLSGAFKKQMSIMATTYQSDDIVNNYLKSRPNIQHLQFMGGDTILKEYFPHRTLPHNIWVDRNGVVKSITDDTEVNAVNIQAFLKGKVKARTKVEDLNFDSNKPYQVDDTSYIFRSTLAPYNSQVLNAGIRNANNDSIPKRFFAWNRPKTPLLWMALQKGRSMLRRDYQYVEVNTADTIGYFFPSYTREEDWVKKYKSQFSVWAENNLYCYELIFNQATSLDDFYEYMLDDLCRYFKVNVYLEDRKTKCWVISIEDPEQVPHESTVDSQETLQFIRSSNTTGRITCKKQPMVDIAKALSGAFTNEPPVLNETGITYPIDLELEIRGLRAGEGFSPEIVFEKLSTLGFKVELKEHDYPFLVIEDK